MSLPAPPCPVEFRLADLQRRIHLGPALFNSEGQCSALIQGSFGKWYWGGTATSPPIFLATYLLFKFCVFYAILFTQFTQNGLEPKWVKVNLCDLRGLCLPCEISKKLFHRGERLCFCLLRFLACLVQFVYDSATHFTGAANPFVLFSVPLNPLCGVFARDPKSATSPSPTPSPNIHE